MKKAFCALALSAGLSSCIPNDGTTRPAPAPRDTGENVILLMFDGVRWQEALGNHADPILDAGDKDDIFPLLWRTHATEGVVLGREETGSRMSVSNPVRVSLPAYESILSGVDMGLVPDKYQCKDNSCGRVLLPTVGERLVGDLGLEKSKVATIASWEAMSLAAEKTEGATFTNAGLVEMPNPDRDPVIDLLNHKQAANAPRRWEHARSDEDTFEQALHYIDAHRPRFLFISLNDSDEWGHLGDYPEYLRTLRRFDGYIDRLIAKLESSGNYGRKTTLIVTTDHGRGDGARWTDHGEDVPEAARIWLYARGPHVVPVGADAPAATHGHADIRPTIEALLGLCPQSCKACGRAIDEIAGRNPPPFLRCRKPVSF